MKLKIESQTYSPGDYHGDRDKYKCAVSVVVGESAMFVVGFGDTAAEAERDAERALSKSVELLDKFQAVWSRAKRFNWWAAEHSSETPPL